MAEVPGEERSSYGVSPAVALRGLGVGAMLLGAAVVGGLLLLSVDPSRSLALLAGIPLGLMAALGLVLLLVGAWRLSGRGPRLVMDDRGFLNATGPRGGVRRAAWRDVRTVRTDGDVVLVELAGGRRSIVRTGSLDVAPGALAKELRRRLDRGHGYRRLT